MIGKNVKAIFVCAVALLMIGLTRPQAIAFSDTEGHWAQEDIQRAVDQGWFSAVSGESFAPDAPLTRALLVSVLADYDNSKLIEDPVSFSDVPEESAYASAVSWAVNHGIVTGTSETQFSPDQTVTREQLASVLINYTNARNKILPRVKKNITFSDMKACSDDTLDAIYTLYRSGILNVTDVDAIQPKAVVTRAEYAVILRKYTAAFSKVCRAKQQGAVISHMGYSVQAPENTLSAYVMSDRKRYSYVETDVRFTKDDVPVLLHDATIDRTSNGSGEVSEMTYQELKAYDFSAQKSGYSNVEITRFEPFIRLCANQYLHPYIELKSSLTDAQAKQLYDIVEKYQMTDHVTWISFTYENLKKIRSIDPTASLGYVQSSADDDDIQAAEKLKNGRNKVYLCASYPSMTAQLRAACLRQGVLLEVWTVDNKKIAVQQLNTSAQGITVDGLTITDLYGRSD